MILLDTDTFSHLTRGHEKVVARLATVTDDAAITIVTRVEALEGRLSFLKRAANGEELLRAQQWLQRTELELAQLPIVLFNEAAAAEFDRLRENKKLKKIGRADLLIAAITLANRATLVSRNLKDFPQVPGLQFENWVD